MNQNAVFVLDRGKQSLDPCHPARARQLLREGKASVFRRFPFTIILHYSVDAPTTTPSELKIDPGAKTTGLALVRHGQNGASVIWSAELVHRGFAVKENLDKRRMLRRSRRSRKTRYRQPRFLNRGNKHEGWLAPSIMSRVTNIMTWAARLSRLAPYTWITVEQVKFDTQLMDTPDISGVDYQQGTLQGFTVREYLLERDSRKCTYCGAEHVPLQVEHIIPRSRGGSDRVTNLTLACPACNQKKGDQTAAEFGFPAIQDLVKQRSMRAVAAVNAARNRLVSDLRSTGLDVHTGSGAETKFNRTQQQYPKRHWIDAACVGASGADVRLEPDMHYLEITATGRQNRQMTRPDKYGFPRTKPKEDRYAFGFCTGDLVKAVVPPGLKTSGTHIGRVAIRSTGSFKISTTDGISFRYCSLIHRSDGYTYQHHKGVVNSSKA